MSFHVDTIPNRNSPPAILLRQAWREGKRIRRRTIANLSKLPPALIHGIRTVVRGGVAFESLDHAVSIRRALPHGHIAAILGTCRHLGLERILHRNPSRRRDLALAALAARAHAPDSKLATARRLSPDTADSSLGPLLGLGKVHGNELLDMLDWLLKRQPRIEKSLANRHLHGGALVLYDLTSSYFEGRRCPLARFGYSRDGKKDRQQMVFGLLCASDGCPVAVEVFSGNTADPTTVTTQVEKIRRRFRIERVALVGDRGMVTTARIREDLQPAGLDWISALTTKGIRKLLQDPQQAAAPPLRPGELLPDTVAEITSPDFPGERLLVCLNPRLREERARKREDLLRTTEHILEDIAAAIRHARLRGRDNINRRVGRDANRKKVEKHFDITATDDALSWTRRHDRIAAEAQLDGIYVVRTSLASEAIGSEAAVEAYKSLSRVEQAFRSIKNLLRVRPVYVYTPDHVRAHVFLCMLAYYVQWHMRRRLAPLLFEDDDRPAARAARNSPVEPARVSQRAKARADTRRTPDGYPVHSFRTLLNDLATLTLNEVTLPGSPTASFPMLACPTPLQQRAFNLLDIQPHKFVASNLTA